MARSGGSRLLDSLSSARVRDLTRSAPAPRACRWTMAHSLPTALQIFPKLTTYAGHESV